MANTIEEILKKKIEESKNYTDRYSIFDIYKNNITKNKKTQSINYARCMQNKCKTCKDKQKCERNK